MAPYETHLLISINLVISTQQNTNSKEAYSHNNLRELFDVGCFNKMKESTRRSMFHSINRVFKEPKNNIASAMVSSMYLLKSHIFDLNFIYSS